MAAFPIDDLNAIVADAQSAAVSIVDLVAHAKNIFSWLGVSLPFFASSAGSSLAACPSNDPAAVVKAFVAERGGKGGVASAAVPPDVLSAIMQLIMMLIQKWLNPTPTP